jgi:hypothetical protein
MPKNGGYALVWPPHQRSLSVRWAISTFKVQYPHWYYILLCSRQGIVGHLQYDFDTGTQLSQIFLYIAIIQR